MTRFLSALALAGVWAVPTAAAAEIPRTTYPMWFTLVYAMRRLRFVCPSDTKAPYTMRCATVFLPPFITVLTRRVTSAL